MTVFVARDGQQLGPYTIEQLRQMVSQGQFIDTDLAWYEGAPDWMPLAQVLQTLPSAAAAAVPMKHPGLGIASFVIGIVSAPLWLVLFVVSALSGAGQADPVDVNKPSPFLVLVGLFFCGGFAVNVLGAILGIAGVQRPNAKKGLSIAGIVLNGVQLAGLIGLIVLGLIMQQMAR